MSGAGSAGEAPVYASPADIFREHARLSGFENGGARVFDISALAEVTDAEYDAGPGAVARPKGGAGGTHVSRTAASRRLRPRPLHQDRARAPRRDASAKYPFVLNTGRVRDQWHTMTRTGLSPRLSVHVAEPFVEIHPRDGRARLRAGHARARVATGTARRCCASC